MKKRKVRYENSPFGKVTLGRETWIGRLPTPEELAERERTAKITLAVTASSLRTLKKQAEKSGIPYQVMIRRLLDAYVLQTR